MGRVTAIWGGQTRGQPILALGLVVIALVLQACGSFGARPSNNSVSVTIVAAITNHEAFGDERELFNATHEFALTAEQPRGEHTFTRCVGGEVVLWLPMTVERDRNGAVGVTGEAQLREGASCTTNDVEDRRVFTERVEPDGVRDIPLPKLTHAGVGGGDTIEFERFHVANRVLRQ